MTRRSAGTAERTHTYGAEDYMTEAQKPDLVSATVSAPNEVNVGGEAIVTVKLDNDADIIQDTDTDYCAAGSKPLVGDVDAYELDVRVEIEEGSSLVTTQDVQTELPTQPVRDGPSGGGGGNPAATTSLCVPANGTRRQNFTVDTDEEGEIEATVTVKGRYSDRRVAQESFSIFVLPEIQTPDRDAGGDDPPEEPNDPGDTPRANPTNPPDPESDESSLTKFWNDRTDGEKVALGLGGAGLLAVLAGR